MNVLLVSPNVDVCLERTPSMGLMNLYLVAEQAGCSVEWLDLTEATYAEGLERILSGQYDVIGISCNFTNSAPYCMSYGREIRRERPDAILVSGGNHATLVPEDLLHNGYDYVVCGEGEVTFQEFLRALMSGDSVRDLEGLCQMVDGEIVTNPPRELIEDLDTLPLNDYSRFDLEECFTSSGLRHISMETSRGCIYNCAFCTTVKIWGRRHRHKSPERILEEFRIAKARGIDFVFIEDDDAALDEQNLREWCRLVINENIGLPWGMGVGTCSIKDDSTFDLLARANCVKVQVSIESANPRILKEYRKPHTVEGSRRLCRSVRERGILVCGQGIVGCPGETTREVLRTYSHLAKTTDLWVMSILEPRPGSDYWDKWEKKADPSAYSLFGKANVILGEKRVLTYLLYRLAALLYFMNPRRFYRAFLAGDKVRQYLYRIQYRVAWRVVKQNVLDFVKGLARPRAGADT